MIGLKWLNGPTRQHHHADWKPLPQERNAESRPIAAAPLSLKECIFGINKDVGYMHGAFFECRACCNRAASGQDRLLFQIVYPFGYVAAAGSTAISIALS